MEQATKISHPYIFTVDNATESTQKVKALFTNAKKENNYGNPHGVTLSSSFSVYDSVEDKISEFSYDMLLSLLDKKTITIGKTDIYANRNTAVCVQPITVHEDTNYGYQGARIHFFKDPYQNQVDSISNNTVYCLRNIHSLTGLILTLPPRACATYYLYPAVIEANENKEQYSAPSLFGGSKEVYVPLRGAVESLNHTPAPKKKSAPKKKVITKKVAPKK